MDFNTPSGLFLGGSASAILEHLGQPRDRDTLNYEVLIQDFWKYDDQEFVLFFVGRPYSWTITARGPATYRGLRVGDSLAGALTLYGRPTEIERTGDSTVATWVMPPRWYPKFGIAVTAIRDTIRSITVGELLLVIM